MTTALCRACEGRTLGRGASRTRGRCSEKAVFRSLVLRRCGQWWGPLLQPRCFQPSPCSCCRNPASSSSIPQNNEQRLRLVPRPQGFRGPDMSNSPDWRLPWVDAHPCEPRVALVDCRRAHAPDHLGRLGGSGWLLREGRGSSLSQKGSKEAGIDGWRRTG